MIGLNHISLTTALLLLLNGMLHSGCVETKKVRYLLRKPNCTTVRQALVEQELVNLVPIGVNEVRRFPETDKEFHVYCSDLNKTADYMEAFFKECTSRFIYDYMKVFLYTARRNRKRHCSGKRETKLTRKLLKVGPCANREIRTDPRALHCHRTFMNTTRQLVNIQSDRLKIPHFCCKYVDYVKCTENYANTVPCMRGEVPQMMDLFHSETSSLVNAVCGDYNDSNDSCVQLGAMPTPTKRNNARYRTPVLLLIHLLASLN